ncbi:TrbI/VirB10 family protein, partial [Pseudomonas sp. EGD-AK9]
GMGAGGAPQLLQTSTSGGGRNSMAQFGQGGQGDRWKLDSQPEAPRTPFELRAGFVVPATLISGINSDLPGQIMAQVAQDVYDTPTGKHLLIPQGSRLVGSYSSDVAYGQARVLVAWQRIVFPDGKAMDIGAMPGADSAGYAGFHDQVNNHYVRLFGSAFLMSGVTAGITYSQRQNQATNTYGAPSASSALSEALGQQLGQVTAQLIAKNLSISPTLEIRPGYRFNVVVTKDMTFSKPYRSFDY